MEHEIRRRLIWISLYQEADDAGLTCRRCGISRPTLRKWIRRYEEQGMERFFSQSRQLKHSAAQKVFEQEEGWILALSWERKVGDLLRRHDLLDPGSVEISKQRTLWCN